MSLPKRVAGVIIPACLFSKPEAYWPLSRAELWIANASFQDCLDKQGAKLTICNVDGSLNLELAVIPHQLFFGHFDCEALASNRIVVRAGEETYRFEIMVEELCGKLPDADDDDDSPLFRSNGVVSCTAQFIEVVSDAVAILELMRITNCNVFQRWGIGNFGLLHPDAAASYIMMNVRLKEHEGQENRKLKRRFFKQKPKD